MLLERTRAGRQTRLHEGSLHTFPLEALVRELREEPTYLEHGRDGVMLLKMPGLRVLLQALRTGEGLSEHQAPGPITLQVVDGELRFQAGEEILYLGPGEVLTLPAAVPHAVEAVRDAAFLLTIGAAQRTTAEGA
ncbi:MAG: hypothetical protein K0Q72_2365 [Armatimonadetes bacterium]|jgi:quercetin dioxygenase-like cupin family protein|nr:hypothetical protein [Armatimonadota bacterium]